MSKTDQVYAAVTKRIIADLEEGTATWHKPWSAGGFAGLPLRANGEPYKGINTLMLWAAAQDAGYGSAHWLTFRQAKAEGGNVRKGERASYVFFAKPITRPGAADGDEDEPKIYMRKAYAVFNVEQCEGLPSKYAKPSAPVNPEQRIAHCEAWFSRLGADIRHGGGRAFYRPSSDHIQMPEFGAFESGASYLYHCHAHDRRRSDDVQRGAGDQGARAGEPGQHAGSSPSASGLTKPTVAPSPCDCAPPNQRRN